MSPPRPLPQHHIRTAVAAVGPYKFKRMNRFHRQDLRIMLPYKAQARRVLFTDNNTGRPFQQCAQQRTDACRPGADNEHGILRSDFRNAYRPKTRGQHVAHQKSLAVADIGRNPVQPLIGIRHPDILRLSPVDAAAQRPRRSDQCSCLHSHACKKSIRRKTSLHLPPLCLRLYSRYCRPHSLHHAHHFVPNGNARHSARHRAVLNVPDRWCRCWPALP